jgi:S-formylglutathione hydrolase FrmB
MTTIKIAAAALAFAAGAWASAPHAQVSYIPPDAKAPRFGGEFALSALGPVSGYWPTECHTWSLRAQEHRDGPPPSPELTIVLYRFITGLIQKQPTYADLSPGMTQAVQHNLDTYWPSINRMGEASVAKKIGSDKGNDVYVIDEKGGETHWNISVNPDGKIDAAFICTGQGI